MENTMEHTKKINICTYYCTYCDFGTNSAKCYMNHTESNKHKRDGNLKTRKCELCNITCLSHWNYKQHYMNAHSTFEEKIKMKYQCEFCNTVFFSKIYFKNHMMGKKHNNIIEAKKRLEYYKLKDFFDQDIGNLNNILYDSLKDIKNLSVNIILNNLVL